MIPVFVTTRAGEFQHFSRWWSKGFRFGIIAPPRPLVSANHARLFSEFPGPKYLDNGIFANLGLTNAELFEQAEMVRANYVFAPDVFADAEATLAQARTAMGEYKCGGWRFALVGVAQGKSPAEYLACARQLQAMGYAHLAVGGLLRRRGDSEKSRQVGAGPLRRIDEGLMWDVLRLIRAELNPQWLHVLGALNHKRIQAFRLLGVVSADSKQWARAYTFFNDYKRTPRTCLQDRFVRYYYFAQRPLIEEAYVAI